MGCSANYVDITGGNVNPDHIHMLISVLSHLLVSKVIQYISGTLQGGTGIKKTTLGTTSEGKRIFCCSIRTDKREGCTKIYMETRGTSQAG
ncbi:MAG: transposase [Alphaproteobacteria bacterium]|nr:transposase [Alphaproteobacteria bacterium]